MSEGNGNAHHRNDEPDHERLTHAPHDEQASSDKKSLPVEPVQETSTAAPEMMKPYVKPYLQTTFEKMRSVGQNIFDYNLHYTYERPGMPTVEMVFYIEEGRVSIKANHLSVSEKDEYEIVAEAILKEVLKEFGA